MDLAELVALELDRIDTKTITDHSTAAVHTADTTDMASTPAGLEVHAPTNHVAKHLPGTAYTNNTTDIELRSKLSEIELTHNFISLIFSFSVCLLVLLMFMIKILFKFYQL